MAGFLSTKTVIRCRDFSSSRRFYTSILGLRVVNEWNEPGGKGCIFGVAPNEGGYVEIYEMTRDDSRYHPSFSAPVQGDKIDLQLRTTSVASWAEQLEGQWSFEGPERLPWGQTWMKLRDPDGLLIAIYEGDI